MGFTDGLSNNLASVFDWNASADDTSFGSSGGDFGPTKPAKDASSYSAFGAGLQELFHDPISFGRDLITVPWINPAGAAINQATGGAVEGTYGGASEPLTKPPPKHWYEPIADEVGISPQAFQLLMIGTVAIVGLFAVGYAVRSFR